MERIHATAREQVERAVAVGLRALPAPLVAAVAALTGPAPRSDRTRLDPGLQLVLAVRSGRGAKTASALGAARARSRFRREAILHAGAAPPLAEVRDLELPLASGVHRARLYRPLASPTGLLVYYHGGGYVIGDVDMYDPVCRRLAAWSGLAVLSVEYALAPERRCPAAIEDGVAALAWARAHAGELGCPGLPVAVGGDSAGGNLSAEVCVATAGTADAPAAQLLIYPAVERDTDYASLRLFATGFLLERAEIDWYHEQYAGAAGIARDDIRVSPLRADLHGQPPALVVTAGFDPLRDEGEAYAEKLEQSGVPTRLLRYDDLIHGFVNMAGVNRRCEHALRELSETFGAMVRG